MLGITKELNRGEMCIQGLVVTKLPSVNGIDIGWGLFTDIDFGESTNDSKRAIRKGAYIGEYLGILYAKTSTPSGG